MKREENELKEVIDKFEKVATGARSKFISEKGKHRYRLKRRAEGRNRNFCRELLGGGSRIECADQECVQSN